MLEESIAQAPVIMEIPDYTDLLLQMKSDLLNMQSSIDSFSVHADYFFVLVVFMLSMAVGVLMFRE